MNKIIPILILDLKKVILQPILNYKIYLVKQYGYLIIEGRKYFLIFGLHGCPPCKIEMPHMENYYNKYKDSNNVEIIAVNMTSKERKREIVQEFVDSYGLTF